MSCPSMAVMDFDDVMPLESQTGIVSRNRGLSDSSFPDLRTLQLNPIIWPSPLAKVSFAGWP